MAEGSPRISGALDRDPEVSPRKLVSALAHPRGASFQDGSRPGLEGQKRWEAGCLWPWVNCHCLPRVHPAGRLADPAPHSPSTGDLHPRRAGGAPSPPLLSWTPCLPAWTAAACESWPLQRWAPPAACPGQRRASDAAFRQACSMRGPVEAAGTVRRPAGGEPGAQAACRPQSPRSAMLFPAWRPRRPSKSASSPSWWRCSAPSAQQQPSRGTKAARSIRRAPSRRDAAGARRSRWGAGVPWGSARASGAPALHFMPVTSAPTTPTVFQRASGALFSLSMLAPAPGATCRLCLCACLMVASAPRPARRSTSSTRLPRARLARAPPALPPSWAPLRWRL